MIYLDAAATTPLCDAAKEAMRPFWREHFHNPGALYRPAVDAARALETARESVAALCGVEPARVVFTSGGTEGNAMALWGPFLARGKFEGELITTAAEHPSVLEAALQLRRMGVAVALVPVDGNGLIDEQAFAAALSPNVLAISVHHVNNETGAVQPIERLRELAKKAAPRARFHSDGVQAFGKLAVPACDYYTLSAHKFGGPRGVGALVVPGGQAQPLWWGGGQERGWRSGTPNVPGIVGLAAAAGRGMSIDPAVENALLGPLLAREDVTLNGPTEGRAPHIANLSFAGQRGEVLLHSLEVCGVWVGTGAACASRKAGSHVLAAMGLPQARRDSAMRLSWSAELTVEQAGEAARIIQEVLDR